MSDELKARLRAASHLFTPEGEDKIRWTLTGLHTEQGDMDDWDMVSIRHEIIARIEELEAQLPEGMKHCTILFHECEKGHGRLSAKNWIDNGCHWCRIEELERERDDFERELTGAIIERDRALLKIDRSVQEAWNEAIEAAAKMHTQRGNNNDWTYWAETEKAIRALKRP